MAYSNSLRSKPRNSDEYDTYPSHNKYNFK